jgi:integrase
MFSIESLRTARQLLNSDGSQRNEFPWIARALIYLKILSKDALTDLFGHPESTRWWEHNHPDVDPQWLAWIRTYIAQTHRYGEEYRRIVFHHLCVAGRWLKRHHPGIVTPEQWDEALSQEYVTWACNAKRGELVSEAAHLLVQKSRADVPLRASSIDGRISALRKFFKDIQRRSYQVGEGPPQRPVLTWNPDEVLATPENIKRQLVPNPRNLDVAWWHKLTWAAASLSTKDLPLRNAVLQPLAYYRAVGLLWVTAARRSDEIRRLKVGCVSREWAPEMRDEDGNLLEPEEDLCYLRVPVNKMQGEFWVPIPSYTADAIEVWERLRPKLQDPQIDRKEKKATTYLFMTRNKLMGQTFLNDSVIPLLCRVAGLVDEILMGRKRGEIRHAKCRAEVPQEAHDRSGSKD